MEENNKKKKVGTHSRGDGYWIENRKFELKSTLIMAAIIFLAISIFGLIYIYL